MRLIAGMLLVAAMGCGLEARAEPGPPGVWRAGESGAYEHLQSGLTCPAKQSGYHRTGASVLDARGLDVACDYSGSGTQVAYRLTLRTPPDGFDMAVSRAKRELLLSRSARHPQLISEIRFPQDGLNWSAAIYSEDGGRRAALWLADIDGWTFGFRAYYPEAQDAAILADVRVIAASVKASAGAHLDLCAKARPVQRTGAAITDRDQVRSAAMTARLLSNAQHATASPSAVVWCVEAIDEDDAAQPMVFWRGLRPDGGDAREDQISLIRPGGPFVLTLTPEPMERLGPTKAGDTASTRWVATVRKGGQTIIYGYFTDRPSQEAAVETVSDIVAGRTKAVDSIPDHAPGK